jgi:hypothetical protein
LHSYRITGHRFILHSSSPLNILPENKYLSCNIFNSFVRKAKKLWESQGKETMALLTQYNLFFWGGGQGDVTACQSPVSYRRVAEFFRACSWQHPSLEIRN